MRRGVVLGGVLIGVLAVSACAAPGTVTPRGKAPSVTAADAPPLCRLMPTLADLRADLVNALPTDSHLAPIVHVDQELAALAVARERLSANPEASELTARIVKLAAALESQRVILARLVEALRTSHANVEASLDEAATCRGVDLRAPSAPPNATREQKRRRAFASETPEVPAQLKRNRATLRAKECGPAVRLAEAYRSLEVTSKVSVASVAGHLKELSFDGPAAKTRDKLARALTDHATRLGALEDAQRANPGVMTALANDLGKLRSDLDDIGETCMARPASAPGMAAAGAQTPRQLTVLVRPTMLNELTGELVPTGSFGSGLLIRSDGPSGTATRVVTNAHVLGEANTAEILEADRVQLTYGRGEKKDLPKPWKATRHGISTDDDVAVLELETAANASLPAMSVTFRPTAPNEQESVTAAGFPAIGASPSFQVSTGTVSNANLKTASGPFGVYVQHTAAIDPGNSGGPLFDARGRLIGINTIKIRGRENVGLAIPSSRIQLALLRAEQRPRFTAKHAESLCNSFVAMLGAASPRQVVVDRLSLNAADPKARALDAETSFYRSNIQGPQDAPGAVTRADTYARLRARLEAEGGLSALAMCESVAPGNEQGTFVARFPTRAARHTLTMAVEDGTLRVRGVD